MKDLAFRGYKWQDHVSIGNRISSMEPFLTSIRWEKLCSHASSLNNDKPCTLDPQIVRGGRNLVRILEFADGARWMARLEVDCMKLVRELTSVPVPEIYGHNASADLIGAPFILMEALYGNVAVDMDGSLIPNEQKFLFYSSLARYQAEISSITFPKIGSIIQGPNGTYDVGPLPKLGGPFATTTKYLKAWAKHARFYGGTDGLKESCGPYGDEILQRVLAFPQKISELTGKIALRENGPFPLIHPDFFHSNIIADDNWKPLGVIDWEYAQSAPWETVEFPLTFSLCPRPMDALWNYDENGVATDEDLRLVIKEREEYVDMVRRFERREGKLPQLSDVLGDPPIQDLATAMRYFTKVGKQGFYINIFNAHIKRWGMKSTESDLT
ncbi:hypothetical protein IMSHALPRED_006780 [Imshaugia aleurites]|uniref:Aminoglycoside phosphotransferase domain-containing protein n=1 Tax=Imshaugia aleurites TaxID=172621 RepID=A0A8H3FL38_9LECA|nr:hypothetical protein IMSHALPRED_006780 [Imshaugia aleurites]